jgi:DNA-binding NarL/FixJ family response regulator
MTHEKKRSRKIINERKSEILKLISNGYESKEIAENLGYSLSMINHDLCEMYNDTFTNNKAHLISWAFRNGVL